MTASIVWGSPNYDYMIVDGKKLLPVNTEGNSVFEIPVASFDTALDVIADTVAMSKPHEIEYKITFDSSTLRQSNQMIKRHSIATVCCVMLIGLAGLCGCGSSSDTIKRYRGDHKGSNI